MTLPLEWRVSDVLVAYPEAFAQMESRVAAIHDGTAPELVWVLEHPPLYTSGTSAKPADLLVPERFPVFDAGRGGQYTYHGPGQLIAYVMLNLKARAKGTQPDIRVFVSQLEQWLMDSLKQLGVEGDRREGRVGIWVTLKNGREAKIAALGIRVRKWITFHGIALNINPDLEHFSGIIPCGIKEHGVTSLADLGIHTTQVEVTEVLRGQFIQIFGADVNNEARQK